MLENTDDKVKNNSKIYWVLGILGVLVVGAVLVVGVAAGIMVFTMSDSGNQELGSMKKEAEGFMSDKSIIASFSEKDGKGSYTSKKFFDVSNTELSYTYTLAGGKFLDTVWVRIGVYPSKAAAKAFVKARIKELNANGGDVFKHKETVDGDYVEYYPPGVTGSKKIQRIFACKDKLCYLIDSLKQQHVGVFSRAFKVKAKF